MNTTASEANDHSSVDRESERQETNICVLHMLVPVEARRRAKLAAIASGLSFRDYVTQLLYQAEPVGNSES